MKVILVVMCTIWAVVKILYINDISASYYRKIETRLTNFCFIHIFPLALWSGAEPQKQILKKY